MLISPSRKCYIGKTVHAKLRFRQHKNARGKCRVLHYAIRKYGWENFLKIVVEVFDDDASDAFMFEREMYWIKYHDTKVPNGYNLTDGGEGASGYRHTQQSRAKMKGRICSVKTRSKIGNASAKRTHSAQTRNKLSIISRERWKNYSPQMRSKIGFRGRTHSSQTKAKLSEINYQTAKKQMKPVIATEKKTGIKRNFESTYAAARTLANETGKKFNRAHVSSCANKRPNYNTHHGWNFEFKSN